MMVAEVTSRTSTRGRAMVSKPCQGAVCSDVHGGLEIASELDSWELRTLGVSGFRGQGSLVGAGFWK